MHSSVSGSHFDVVIDPAVEAEPPAHIRSNETKVYSSRLSWLLKYLLDRLQTGHDAKPRQASETKRTRAAKVRKIGRDAEKTNDDSLQMAASAVPMLMPRELSAECLFRQERTAPFKHRSLLAGSASRRGPAGRPRRIKRFHRQLCAIEEKAETSSVDTASATEARQVMTSPQRDDTDFESRQGTLCHIDVGETSSPLSTLRALNSRDFHGKRSAASDQTTGPLADSRSARPPRLRRVKPQVLPIISLISPSHSLAY